MMDTAEVADGSDAPQEEEGASEEDGDSQEEGEITVGSWEDLPGGLSRS